MKAMETLQDLIEEIKLRTVWWALFVFAVSYFLTHTSKSMWMNVPISILLVCGLRILLNEVDFRWKVRSVHPQTYLSHLKKKQLSVNDSRLSYVPPLPRWKRKIDSPVVEAAMKDFIDKILKDFVVDLWYSEITPDREFPEHIRAIIMDALGEISGRVKEMNLVDLLTRDIVDLVGNHMDLFRRNQTAIGADVMGTLSSEERDERLKHHLMASKELHPALISPESEYKVLQWLMNGLLTVVLKPRETQCPAVLSIARELLTCLVMQPIMNFASPGYINELIEFVYLAATKEDSSTEEAGCHQTATASDPYHGRDDYSNQKQSSLNDTMFAPIVDHSEPLHPRNADWVHMLDVATQRRTEVLMPENLENMWTKGRYYKKKEKKSIKVGIQEPIPKVSGVSAHPPTRNLGSEMLITASGTSMTTEEKSEGQLILKRSLDTHFSSPLSDRNNISTQIPLDPYKEFTEGEYSVEEFKDNSDFSTDGDNRRLKRSSSTSALKFEPDMKKPFTGEGVGSIISEFYSPNFGRRTEERIGNNASDMVVREEGQLAPKLKSRVIGAYFEKLGSKSFAVYSIAVTDVENRTWFVKRRYRNFERLHRHLKDIPNYTLHLPPKRIFSSSTEDAFVHQRCIQLDKYLQDLLSIANVAEQHEVWDFLSVSSKNYSFGKSPSVMRTLAVNVDDAMDDIVRQFKGVSGGLIRKVSGSTLSTHVDEGSSSVYTRNNPDEISKHISSQYSVGTANSFSDNEAGNDNPEEVSGWHSDNELSSKRFPPRMIKHENKDLVSEKKNDLAVKFSTSQGGFPATSYNTEDPVGMPPEWTPPKVSVPLLNLVDKIFQLNRRGWIRRQVLWISKQILQLIMEDAIDDWLLRHIHWLRRDDIIAQGIRWVQDILWPNGTFFIKIANTQNEDDDDIQSTRYGFQTTSKSEDGKISKPGSFEQQLEAARRASDVKKMLFGGAPSAVVSLIGNNQYKRCAKDIYYFTQSTVCVKQLAYGILELLLVSVFPELQNLVLDVHEKMSP